jgi:hypothetical protein
MENTWHKEVPFLLPQRIKRRKSRVLMMDHGKPAAARILTFTVAEAVDLQEANLKCISELTHEYCK